MRRMSTMMGALWALTLLISSTNGAFAAWVAGTYQVDSVITSTGNYTYRPSGSSVGGYVNALSHASQNSTIEVRYSRTWNGLASDPNLTVTANGHLTGTSSGPQMGSSCDPGSSGFYSKSGAGGSPYDSSFTFGSYPAVSPTSATFYSTAKAWAFPIIGGQSASSDSEVYLN